MACTILMVRHGLSLGVDVMTGIEIINQLMMKNNKNPSSYASIVSYLILKGLFHKRVVIPPEIKEVANV